MSRLHAFADAIAHGVDPAHAAEELTRPAPIDAAVAGMARELVALGLDVETSIERARNAAQALQWLEEGETEEDVLASILRRQTNCLHPGAIKRVADVWRKEMG